MTQIDIGHSTLGASGASRWMNCGASVELSKEMEQYDDYSVDPEYRVHGSASHHVAAQCLANGFDAWELGDRIYEGVKVTDLDVECVQTYVDYCRKSVKEDDQVFIEHPIGEKVDERPHPAFFGTVDFAIFNAERMHIIDFKYGQGILIDPVENKQCMYYAYGILRDIERQHGELDADFPVKITIVQPRTFEEKAEKIWDTTAGHIMEWANEEMLPKMRNPGSAFLAGEHCRFCPAKLICPLLKGMFQVAATINSSWVKNANSLALGQEWKLIAPAKMYIKAVQDETYNRLMAGQTEMGVKLVNQKANRVWKPGALEIIQAKLGDLAMSTPELKSPAQIAELGESANELVKEWAFTPQTGYTVADADDKKAGIKMPTPEEKFAHFLQG